MLPLSRRRRNLGLCNYWRSSLGVLQSRLFVSWETEALNGPLFNFGARHSRRLKLWFSLGVGIGCLLEVVIVFMMLLWMFSWLKGFGNQPIAGEYTHQSEQALTLVIPGINVPWSDFPFMILATTFAVGIHELGHAMAAASEGVRIEHVAVFLACLIPGALVALDQETLQLLPHVRTLRIYCAGVWHNVMCCAGCYLLLILLPVILSPFYVQNKYPVVSSLDTKSPLVGHLKVGDGIITVAGLELSKPDDWLEILYVQGVQGQTYFNQSIDTYLRDHQNNLIKSASRMGVQLKLHQHIASNGFCACSLKSTELNSRPLDAVCPNDAMLFFQHPCTGATSINSLQSIFCLKAADVVNCPACRLDQNLESTSHLCSCFGNMSCLFPFINDGEVFVNIKVQLSSSKHCHGKLNDPDCEHSLVFVGDPKVLFDSLQLSKYWPRQAGFLGLLPVSSGLLLPKFLERLLMYTISISAAMAMLNSTPVYYLDGELIFRAWLGWCCKSWVHSKRLKRFMQVWLTVGTTSTAFFLVTACLQTLS